MEEQQRNAGHLAEIDDLQKGYDEKLTAFEVSSCTPSSPISSQMQPSGGQTSHRRSHQGLQEVREGGSWSAGEEEASRHQAEEAPEVDQGGEYSSDDVELNLNVWQDGQARSEAHSSIDNFSSELDTNRAKVATLEEKLVAEEAELEEVRDSLKGPLVPPWCISKLTRNADKTDEFTEKIEAKQRELEPWTAKISEKQSAIDVAQSERDSLAEKAAAADAAMEDARANLKSLKQGDGSKQAEHDELKKEAVQVKKALASGEQDAEVGSLEDEFLLTNQAMTSKSDRLRNELSAARQKLDEAKASLAADKSENAVLSSLNKLKDQGRIKGFHGRLGDLGVIDGKYDVAVTTACGALNNLVVDTVEQGQACIEHLRKGNVGRASFMVLEKLPPRDLGPIETPENVPRLFDLIKPKDTKFAPAFYKGVFNTLVADDLAQAQRIGFGKKRWRVVTLAGQLIDPSGTMSGGGTKVFRGGMSSKFTADKVAPEVVARYENECAAAEQAFADFQKERKASEAELGALKKRLPEIEIAMEKIELDVNTASKRIQEAEKRLRELQ